MRRRPWDPAAPLVAPLDTPRARRPRKEGTLIGKQIRMEGFLVHRWKACVARGDGDILLLLCRLTRSAACSEFPAATAELAGLVGSGKLKFREHITEGFDNMPEVCLRLH